MDHLITNDILVQTVGSCAAVLTTVSYVPQVMKILRERRTAGISVGMYCAITLGYFLWLIYGLMISSLPIIISNVVALPLVGSVLALKLYVDREKRH